MPVRFRILPADDARPGAGPLVEREVELPEALDEIRLGRRADVELPLPFAALSAVHARLVRAPDGWTIEDAGSTNGTWLDDDRLAPGERRAVEWGAELRLGNVRLRFEGEGPSAAAAEGTATIARRLVDDLFAGARDGAPALEIVRGAAAGRLALVDLGRPYVVGRAEGCALPLAVEEVSREHAIFVRDAAGVLVRDLGSKNGVVVAGVRVAGERKLADGDVIEIGPVALRLDDPVGRYIASLAGGTSSPPRAPQDPAEAPQELSEASRAGEARAPVDKSSETTQTELASEPKRRRAPSITVVVAVAVLILVAAAAAAFLF
jgi:pSer/pThr/pTyr-binding forkhead associated (FHA) protein